MFLPSGAVGLAMKKEKSVCGGRNAAMRTTSGSREREEPADDDVIVLENSLDDVKPELDPVAKKPPEFGEELFKMTASMLFSTLTLIVVMLFGFKALLVFCKLTLFMLFTEAMLFILMLLTSFMLFTTMLLVTGREADSIRKVTSPDAALLTSFLDAAVLKVGCGSSERSTTS